MVLAALLLASLVAAGVVLAAPRAEVGVVLLASEVALGALPLPSEVAVGALLPPPRPRGGKCHPLPGRVHEFYRHGSTKVHVPMTAADGGSLLGRGYSIAPSVPIVAVWDQDLLAPGRARVGAGQTNTPDCDGCHIPPSQLVPA